MKMSLTRILSEIKLTVKKLDDSKLLPLFDAKAVDQLNTVTLKVGLEDAKKRIQGNFDSWKDLTKNLNTLRSALVGANASTSVTINGQTYTIAQAIDRRKNIESESAILTVHERALAKMKSEIAVRHDQLITGFKTQIEEKLKSASNTKLSDDDLKVLKRTFVDAQEFELVDPVGLTDKLLEMRKDLEAFKSEVDIILTEANSTTQVEVEIG